MNPEVVTLFENVSKTFISDTMPEQNEVQVEITSPRVLSQSMSDIVVQNDMIVSSGETRRLQANPDLLVELEINGKVFSVSPPDTFSFSSTVLYGFMNNFTSFMDDLQQTNSFFISFDPSKIMGPVKSDINFSPWKITSIVLGAAIAAMAALALATYTVRRNNLQTLQLSSPRRTPRFGPLYSEDSGDVFDTISQGSDGSESSDTITTSNRHDAVVERQRYVKEEEKDIELTIQDDGQYSFGEVSQFLLFCKLLFIYNELASQFSSTINFLSSLTECHSRNGYKYLHWT